MKNIIALIVFPLFLISCAQNTKSDYQVLKGAAIFDGNGNIIYNGIIVVKDGIIEKIGDESTPIPGNSNITNLVGKYITPGLVDAHVHFFQTGFFDSRPDAFDIRDSIDYVVLQEYLSKNPEPYFETYLRSGVTAVYDVGGFPWSLSLSKLSADNINAPYAEATGPLLTPVPSEYLSTFNTSHDTVLHTLISSEQGIRIVKKNHESGANGIKIWSLNLEDSAFMANLRSVKVSIDSLGNKMIVHATGLNGAKEAIRLGANVLVHSVDNTIVDNEFIQLAKDRNVIYCPTLLAHRGYYDAFKSLKEGFNYVDPNNAMDERTKGLLVASTRFMKYWPSEEQDFDNYLLDYDNDLKEIERNMATNLKLVYEAGIPIAVGTDAGNPGTFHGISIYPEMSALQEVGIPALDIITMATKNGALAMGRLDDFGTLEKGKIANLIILEKDPSENINNMSSISHVMRSGLLRPVNEPFENMANNK